ncbi:MAG: hypothetical protein WC586_03200 [Methanoregula sp.]
MTCISSPLEKLTVFLLVLSLFGTIAGGIVYYAVELPAQKMRAAPAKMDCAEMCHRVLRPSFGPVNPNTLYETCISSCNKGILFNQP